MFAEEKAKQSRASTPTPGPAESGHKEIIRPVSTPPVIVTHSSPPSKLNTSDTTKPLTVSSKGKSWSYLLLPL